MADGLMPDQPLTGRLEGARHRLPIRVYYEDTDAGSIVYHAVYLKYAERARTEMMRLTGLGHSDLLARHGVRLAVHRCTVEYHHPARLDDALVVESRITAASGATITMEQIVQRAEAGGHDFLNLATLTLRLVILDRQLRPTRLPSALRAVVSTYL